MTSLYCADNKATKLMKELEGCGLIERKRRGLGKPNLIYVKNFASDPLEPRDQNRENNDSRAVKTATPGPLKSRGIKNNQSDTDLSETDPFFSGETAGTEAGDSARNVQRFIRLTNLIPELLELVAQKKISFNPAVELSYLTDAEQRDFFEAMQDTQNAPSLSQAQRIKKLSQAGQCSYEAIFDIMGEEKKAEMDRVTIKNDVLRKYFPNTPRARWRKPS